jgi:hypothetical protein
VSLLGEPTHPGGHLLASWLKRLALLPRSLLLREVILQRGSRDHFPAPVIYLGEGLSLPYLQQFFHQAATPEKQAIFSVGQLHQRMASLNAAGCLTIVEVNRLLSFLRPADSFLSYPWVRQKIRLTARTYSRCRREIEAAVSRSIRKNGYHYRLAGIEAVNSFYYQFYLPYIQHRYGELAHPRSYREVYGAVGAGFLLQIFDGEDWVGGEVYRRQGNVLVLMAVGCLPPYEFRLKRGTLAAAKYFSMRWSQDNGIAVIDLLRSRPHTQDGLYEHKRRWGAEPSVDPWVHTEFWLSLPPGQELPGCLKNLLVVENGTLTELVQLWGDSYRNEKNPGQ